MSNISCLLFLQIITEKKLSLFTYDQIYCKVVRDSENTLCSQTFSISMKKPLTIQQSYIDYILDNGARPPSVFAFSKSLKMKEADFYELYGSFNDLEQQIFLSFFENTIAALQKDKVYQGYSIREKLLALYFTWFESMTGRRSLVVFFHQVEGYFWEDDYITATKEAFMTFVTNLINEGIERGEIADRILLPQGYKYALWGQVKYLFNFWLSDNSKNFEKTDAAIEKVTNFGFDLMEPNSLDSGWDLMRFLWQN